MIQKSQTVGPQKIASVKRTRIPTSSGITVLTYITIRHRVVTVLRGYESAWQPPSRVRWHARPLPTEAVML
jgi:hypothetical protein